MDAYVEKVAQFVMDSVPEAKTVLSLTAPGRSGNGSVNSGAVRISLVEPKERKRSQQQIVDMVSRNMEDSRKAGLFLSRSKQSPLIAGEDCLFNS